MTPAVPGRASRPAIPFSGDRVTSTPSRRRPSTDNRPYNDDMTSKPSAAPIQRLPKSTAPTRTHSA